MDLDPEGLLAMELILEVFPEEKFSFPLLWDKMHLIVRKNDFITKPIFYWWSLWRICADIRRDSVSLLKFPFRSHVQIFPCEISPVCRLKYPYSCFSSNFYFLVLVLFVMMLSVMLLATVINPSFLSLMSSLCPCIEASTLSSILASSLPSFFLDT